MRKRAAPSADNGGSKRGFASELFTLTCDVQPQYFPVPGVLPQLS